MQFCGSEIEDPPNEWLGVGRRSRLVTAGRPCDAGGAALGRIRRMAGLGGAQGRLSPMRSRGSVCGVPGVASALLGGCGSTPVRSGGGAWRRGVAGAWCGRVRCATDVVRHECDVGCGLGGGRWVGFGGWLGLVAAGF